MNWFLDTFPELKKDEDKKDEANATAAEEDAPASEAAADQNEEAEEMAKVS